jgi:hypothetical protein
MSSDALQARPAPRRRGQNRQPSPRMGLFKVPVNVPPDVAQFRAEYSACARWLPPHLASVLIGAICTADAHGDDAVTTFEAISAATHTPGIRQRYKCSPVSPRQVERSMPTLRDLGVLTWHSEKTRVTGWSDHYGQIRSRVYLRLTIGNIERLYELTEKARHEKTSWDADRTARRAGYEAERNEARKAERARQAVVTCGDDEAINSCPTPNGGSSGGTDGGSSGGRIVPDQSFVKEPTYPSSGPGCARDDESAVLFESQSQDRVGQAPHTPGLRDASTGADDAPGDRGSLTYLDPGEIEADVLAHKDRLAVLLGIDPGTITPRPLAARLDKISHLAGKQYTVSAIIDTFPADDPTWKRWAAAGRSPVGRMLDELQRNPTRTARPSGDDPGGPPPGHDPVLWAFASRFTELCTAEEISLGGWNAAYLYKVFAPALKASGIYRKEPFTGPHGKGVTRERVAKELVNWFWKNDPWAYDCSTGQQVVYRLAEPVMIRNCLRDMVQSWANKRAVQRLEEELASPEHQAQKAASAAKEQAGRERLSKVGERFAAEHGRRPSRAEAATYLAARAAV